MAIAAGFSKTVTDGLILGYDTADLVNSYSGRPTTNLLGTGMSIYNNVPGNVSATLDTNGEFYRGAPVYIQTLTAINGAGVSQLSNGNNPGIGVVIGGGGGGLANRYTGHSIFFKPTVTMHSSPIFTNYSNIGGWQSGNNFEDMGDGWFRAYVIWYNTVDGNDGKFWAINPLTATLNTPITIYWAGPFKEDLNVQNVSQYTVGTRTSTQGLIDFKRVYDFNLGTTSFDNSISPKFNFDGTDDFIQTNITGTFPRITYEFMGFFDDPALSTTSRNESAFGDWNSNRVHFGTRWSVGMHWNVNNGWTTIPTTNLRYGWNHYVLVYDTVSNQKLVYLNGILSNTETTNGDMVMGDFKIGVASALGAHYRGNIDVFKIYNRPLSSREVLQNFGLYRTRFGI